MASVAMVDTNVVIYSMRRPKPKDPEALKSMLTASADLMKKLSHVRICALTQLEVMRGLRPKERPAVEAVFKRLHVEAVSGAAAERAVQLLAKRNNEETVCPRCLSSKQEHKCVACGRTASSQQRLNDALIAATADVCDHDCVLYAFDKGVLAFSPHVQRCKIQKPPNSWGALFDKPYEASLKENED